MLLNDRKLIPIAADDNHNSHGFYSDDCDSFIGYNMIKAENLDYESIIKALEKGDTYATEAPEIYEMYIENDTLYVKTSPVCRVILSTLGRRNACVQRKNGDTLTECAFSLDENRRFFRIELVDREGKRAFTRHYEN